MDFANEVPEFAYRSLLEIYIDDEEPFIVSLN